MKRTTIVIAVAAAALLGAGAAFAQMGNRGGGPGAGCIYGAGYTGTNANVNGESLKKFQKETLSLRDELVAKRAEIGNEYAKQTPDITRIAELRKQMIDIQAKIQQAAVKNGLPAMGQGYGRAGRGRGMMAGPGQNGCPRWQ